MPNIARCASDSFLMLNELPQGANKSFRERGLHPRVQDVRGKYHSEGDLRDDAAVARAMNSSEVDHSTDAYDTIDWLVKNVPESNEQSRHARQLLNEGFTVVMALVHPHPALKVGRSDEPDGRWLDGRRLVSLQARFAKTTSTTSPGRRKCAAKAANYNAKGLDDYDPQLLARRLWRGWKSGGDGSDAVLEENLRASRIRFVLAESSARQSHERAAPHRAGQCGFKALWDREDMWGAIHCYLAVEPNETTNNDKNYLVMGPWRHEKAA